MAAETFTLRDFEACLDRTLSRSKSGELLRDLYHQGFSAVEMQAFRPERMEADLRRLKAVISSMTLDESSNPDKISDSRRTRIASGSGVNVDVVGELLAQFRQMSTMIQKLSALRTQQSEFLRSTAFQAAA
jgi:signal recognition particle subunit SRP54